MHQVFKYDYIILSNALKYAAKLPTPDEQSRHAKALRGYLNQQPKRITDIHTPADVVTAGMKRWWNFRPTHDVYEPSTGKFHPIERDTWHDLLSKHGPIKQEHLDEFHNLSAVLAGRKPATVVSSDFVLRHPVGQEMLNRAHELGHTNFIIRKPTGNKRVIGEPTHVDAINNALKSGDRDSFYRHLGYPQSVVDSKHTPVEEERVPFERKGS